MNTKNKTGPKPEPWGTPDMTGRHYEDHGLYVRTVGKTGVTSVVVDRSMFTIKHPPKDMTLQCNVLWQDSGTFPTKLRQIVLCSHAQFGWRLQNKTANQRNSVPLCCTN